MAKTSIQPLDWQSTIVDRDGRPTQDFSRIWQSLYSAAGVGKDGSAENAEAIANLELTKVTGATGAVSRMVPVFQGASGNLLTTSNVYVTFAGRLGVGTNAPDRDFHVKSSTQARGKFESTTGQPCTVDLIGPKQWRFGAIAGGYFSIQNLNTMNNIVRIDSAAPGLSFNLLSSGVCVFQQGARTVNDPYSSSWSGSTDVPTKGAIYNKIESLPSGGGGSGRTLLATYNPTAVPQVDIALPSGYTKFEIELEVVSANDNVRLYARFTDDNFATVKTSNYSYADVWSNVGGIARTASNSAAFMQLAQDIGNASGETTWGVYTVSLAKEAGTKTSVGHKYHSVNYNGAVSVGFGGSGYNLNGVMNGLRLYFSSGNIASGVIKVYGS